MKIRKIFYIFLFILTSIHISPQKTDLEEYNLKGHVKKWTTEEYGYDENNNLVLEKITIYQINKYGYITEFNSYGKKYNTEYKIKYIYSKDNLLKSLEYYHLSEKYYSKTEYYYNNKNQIKKMNQYNGAGTLLNIFFYIYDSNGNIISIEEKTPNYLLNNIYTYRYNENNRMTEYIVYTPNHTVTHKFLYEYDKNGYLVKMTNLKKIKTYKYELDYYGNKIKEYIKVSLKKPDEGIYRKYKIHKYEYWK